MQCNARRQKGWRMHVRTRLRVQCTVRMCICPTTDEVMHGIVMRVWPRDSARPATLERSRLRPCVAQLVGSEFEKKKEKG